jgi:hypothetical protein
MEWDGVIPDADAKPFAATAQISSGAIHMPLLHLLANDTPISRPGTTSIQRAEVFDERGSGACQGFSDNERRNPPRWAPACPSERGVRGGNDRGFETILSGASCGRRNRRGAEKQTRRTVSGPPRPRVK